MTRHAAIIAAAAALYFAGMVGAQAQPMRCSTEERACIALCNRNTNVATVPNCVLGCRTKMAACKQTGCWGTAAARYCGLTRQ